MLQNLLHNRGVVLILIGGVLLLASSGTITTHYFGFEPLDQDQAVRYVLLGIAGLLILSGLAITLKEQGVHHQILGWAHVALSAALLVGFGTWLSLQPRAAALASAEPVFLRWEAGPDNFYAELSTTQLEPYADTHKALLLCRINDPSVPIEQDERIIKSALYSLKGKDRLPIRINYDTAFRARLMPNDHVECHLALLPAKYQSSEIVRSLGQLRDEFSGVLPERYVFDQVSDCPLGPSEPVPGDPVSVDEDSS